MSLNGSSNVLDLTSTSAYSLTNAAALNLNGASSGFSVNGTAYTVIRDVTQLQAMSSNLTGRYVLASDIDASDTMNWNSGAGFVPVGSLATPFRGVLEGLGHDVNGLFINRSGVSYIGLIGYGQNTQVQNIGMTNVNIRGSQYVGALIGYANINAGNTSINRAYSTGTITATSYTGGLIGDIAGPSGTLSLSNSYSSVGITGNNRVGGLVGILHLTGTSSATMSVTNSSASGSVTALDQTPLSGGLVGRTFRDGGSGTINISNSFSSASVTVPVSAVAKGGFLGNMYSGVTLNNNYWNTQSSGQANGVGSVDSGGVANNLIGLNAAQSSQLSSYGNWGSTIDAQAGTGTTWRIYEGLSAPLLRTFLRPISAVSVHNTNKTYDGTVFNSFSYGITDAGVDSSKLIGSVTGGRNVGTYALNVYSSHQGYDFVTIGGTLNISKADLVISSADVSKTYDGNTSTAGTAVAATGTQVFAGDNLIGGNFVFSDKHAGSAKTVTVSGVTVDDGNNGNNYAVTYADNSSSTINKASLVISSDDVTKTYDGSTSAAGTAVAAAGTQVFAGDNLIGGNFAFIDKHAGSGKTVTVSAVAVHDGNNGNNYDVSYADNTNSTINKASLVISTADVTKTYDGTEDAAGTAVAASGTQVFSGDSLSGGTFAFTNKHAATGTKIVTVSGVTVSDGNSGNNYDVSYTNNTSSTINRAALVLSTTDVTKTYDGTTDAAGTAVATSGTQVFAGDNLNGGTFAFDTKHAATGKTVSTSGVTVSDGNSGNNYDVSYADNTSSTINKASLSVSATDASKVYDGTTTANSTAVIVAGGLLSGDTLNGATFNFADKNAGTGKHVVVSSAQISDGNNGDNYDVTYVDNTNSSISKRLLTISAVADSKVYDGKLTSTGKPVVAGRQRGDSIAGLTQSYLDKNAGTGKAINVDAGYTIRDGNNGNNYDVVIVNSIAGVITPRALTISTVANSKVYDGGVTSANKLAVTGLVSGDRVTGLFQQYETKTVGENKQLLIKAGYVLQDGNGGGNYSVTEQTSNNGEITTH